MRWAVLPYFLVPTITSLQMKAFLDKWTHRVNYPKQKQFWASCWRQQMWSKNNNAVEEFDSKILELLDAQADKHHDEILFETIFDLNVPLWNIYEQQNRSMT